MRGDYRIILSGVVADYMGSDSHHPKHATAGLGKILRNHLGCQRDQLNLRTLAALGTGLGMHPLSSGPNVVCPHVSDQPQPSGDKGLGEYGFENQRGGLGILKPSQPNRRVPDRSGLTRLGSVIVDDRHWSIYSQSTPRIPRMQAKRMTVRCADIQGGTVTNREDQRRNRPGGAGGEQAPSLFCSRCD